ncbi:MAG: nucleotidyltransferase family protein [Bacteroidetes bacterium]|nr:nucleotidyltransferase family protein [Bacteroidota bacterium]
MKAMILAAGLGTRLRPITDTTPKALVEINGKTLLEHSINHLQFFGVKEAIINVHHFPDMIISFLKKKKNFGMKIEVSDERDALLDTGGALKKASWFFDGGGPFVVRNVDVLSNLDLGAMLEFHHKLKPVATLAVRNRETSRYMLFNERFELIGWTNVSSGEKKISRKDFKRMHPLAFSGIQILDPSLIPLISEEGRFSLISMYLRLSRDKRICAFNDNDSFWFDAGKREEVL